MSVEKRQLPIPHPAEYAWAEGEFTFGADSVLASDEANHWNSTWLRELLASPSGLSLPIASAPSAGRAAIRLRADPTEQSLGQEGYSLRVSPDTIDIVSSSTTGVFYGLQTLRQLLPPEIESRTLIPNRRWSVPCVSIRDTPRFAWRGYMLDEGRHFHGKAAVLRTLDLMALQKLNVFHWHLTEDQGWRVEIQRYPRLAEVASKRKGTRPTLGWLDGRPHAGCYSHKEIREVVRYAAERQIRVVPEIDMPGHSLAALAAYPELSCTGGPFEVACRPGIFRDIFCAGKEKVFSFLESVLDEIVELFPSPYIHIGNDEAPTKRWKRCADCQNRIAQERLGGEAGLQTYFFNRVAAHLEGHGRTAIGWNDVLSDGIVEGAIVQYWLRRRSDVVRAIRRGRRAIASSQWSTYLDLSHRLVPLEKAYAYDPVFPELSECEADRVLGLEAALWTELVRTRERLDVQSYPRLPALAEVGWSPRAAMDFGDFEARLESFERRLDQLGVGYSTDDHRLSGRIAHVLALPTIFGYLIRWPG